LYYGECIELGIELSVEQSTKLSVMLVQARGRWC